MSIATTANGTLAFIGPEDQVAGTPMAPYFNFKLSNTMRARRGLGRAASGQGNCIGVALGDSNTTGHGAGTDGTGYTGGATRNYPYALANLLAAPGNKHTSESFFGTQNITTWETINFDSRISFNNANWLIGTDGGASLGAWMLKFAGASATALSFTPTVPFDNFTIYYAQNTALGSFTTNIDGGASLGTTATAGTAAFQTVSYTATRGTHTINITPTAATTPIYIAGIRVWDSQNVGIEVWNWGYDGSRSQDHLNAVFPWTNFNAYKNVVASVAGSNIPPDFIVLNLMLNDCNMNTPIATYISNMQQLITQLLINSDVILAMPFTPAFSQGVSSITQANFTAYIQAYYGLAITNNLPVIDSLVRYGSFSAIQPLGYTFNELHLSQLGYGDYAESVFRALNSMA